MGVRSGVLFLVSLLAATFACTQVDVASPVPESRSQAVRPTGEPPGVELVSGYFWDLPPGFPVPLVPADNPMSAAKVELGRHLFYDGRLSRTGTFSCASCHRQELAFTDGVPGAVGATHEIHPRGSMSLANVAYNRTQNWADPETAHLEDQLLVPMFGTDPVELGLTGRGESMLAALAAEARYAKLFADAFPDQADPIALDNVAKALASFERTLISGDSPYDRLVFQDHREALSPDAKAGMRLFFSERLRCFECHSGFTFSGPVIHELTPENDPVFHNTGLYAIGLEAAYPEPNRGVFEFTGVPEDMGRFKAPTLRNIALTSPYMHDGRLATLEEVLDFYAAGGLVIESGPEAGDGRESPYKSELIGGFDLSERERAQVIAFLDSLTDEGFVTSVRLSNPWE